MESLTMDRKNRGKKKEKKKKRGEVEEKCRG
jgi:hypothetical protein